MMTLDELRETAPRSFDKTLIDLMVAGQSGAPLVIAAPTDIESRIGDALLSLVKRVHVLEAAEKAAPAPHASVEPPAPHDHDIPAAVSESIEDLRRQVAALTLQIKATSAPPPPVDDDIPKFLRRGSFSDPAVDTLPAVAPVVSAEPTPIDQRLQDQVDDIWAHLRDQDEDKIAKQPPQGQIDDLWVNVRELWAHIREVDAARARDVPPEPKVVPPPLPIAPQPDHSGAIADLTEWLSRIETIARSAKETADAVSARPVAPVAVPVAVTPQPVISARDRAILDIRAASAARRAALIGETADERDVRQRLAEVALNARGSHQPSIDLLEKMSPSMGMTWGDAATMLAAEHDVANRVALETLALETVAVSDVSAADDASVGAVLARFMNDIERIGA